MRTLIAFLLVFAACTQPVDVFTNNVSYNTFQTKSIYIDKDFSSDQLIFINQAIDNWNYSLNWAMSLKVVDTSFDVNNKPINCNNCWYIEQPISSEEVISMDIERNLITYGWANFIGGDTIKIVSNRVNNNMLSGVVRHEIGHLLGAIHKGNYLMFPYYDEYKYECIDKETAEQVSTYYKFDTSVIGKMNYCIKN
jgi:hypothetical protein